MNFQARLLPFAVLLFILPFPGTVALRLLALAGGLIVCAYAWHKDGFPEIPVRTALLLWAGCALLSLFTAVNPAYSLGEIKNEIGYTMAAYLGFLTLTRKREDAVSFLAALILGNVTLSVSAIAEQFTTGTVHWSEGGLAGGSGSYSSYLLIVLPVLLWAGFVFRFRYRWAAFAGLAVLQLAVAVLTAQRVFWMVLALQALVALYLLYKRGIVAISAGRARAIGVLVILLSVLVIIGVTVKRFESKVWIIDGKTRHFESQALGSWIQDPRIGVWSAVGRRVLEQPLTGKGFGRQTMKNAYPDLVFQQKYFWEQVALGHPHNMFLNYGIAMGVPGMILLVLVFFALLGEFWRLSGEKDHRVAMAGICGVMLVVGVVGRNLTNDFFQRDIALLFWAMAGMMLGYASHATRETKLDR